MTIALLGSIESLLCARVADNMVDLPRHDPNQELMAQGVANLVTPFFGGIPATGTIARTVTNVRAGGTSPIAGIVHALTLLLVVLGIGMLGALQEPIRGLTGPRWERLDHSLPDATMAEYAKVASKHDQVPTRFPAHYFAHPSEQGTNRFLRNAAPENAVPLQRQE